MPTGTIARLLIDKGFGFIRDEGGIEHFFHRSSVRGAVFELLREGSARRVHPGRLREGSARRRRPPDRRLDPTHFRAQTAEFRISHSIWSLHPFVLLPPSAALFNRSV